MLDNVIRIEEEKFHSNAGCFYFHMIISLLTHHAYTVPKCNVKFKIKSSKLPHTAEVSL